MTIAEPDEGGVVPPPVYTLTRVHTPEFHTHVPDKTKHLAQSILEKMKMEVTKNPCEPIGIITFSGCNLKHFWLRQELKKSLCVSVCVSVCPECTQRIFREH